MNRKRKGSDDLLALLVNSPWWIGPILALVAFSFFRFVIPAVVGGISDSDNASTKTVGSILAPISTRLAPFASLGVIALWLLAELKKLADRKRLDSQTGIESIRALSWYEFEELLAEAFRRQGYQVEVVASAGGDGGVDLEMRRGEELALVQCKQWRAWKVGVKVIRELLGVKVARKAGAAFVVTSGSYTKDAQDFASENDLRLIAGFELAEMIRSVQKSHRPPSSRSPVAQEAQ